MKKRIALVVNSLSGGGAERVVSNLSLYLGKTYGIDIILNDDGEPVYPWRGRKYSLGMKYRGSRSGTRYQLVSFRRRIRLLRHLRAKNEYEAVLSFSEMTNLANVLSSPRENPAGPGKPAGTRTILTILNSVRQSARSGWKYRLWTRYALPWMLRRADCTVSCSREIEEELVSRYGLPREKSRVIYNGLDLETIRKMAAEPLNAEEEKLFHAEDRVTSDKAVPEPSAAFRLISVGRLTRQKGHWHLLRALKSLREDGLQVSLLVLGEGELRPALEKLTEDLGLTDCVRFPGYVDNPFQYIAAADAAVFPSLYEGFSCAIAETLACGIPCISTDHETGARELLAPSSDIRLKVKDRVDYAEYGILVPVCDGRIRPAADPLTREEQLLKRAIRRILTDRKLAEKYRKTAPRRAQELDIRRICREWEKLL